MVRRWLAFTLISFVGTAMAQLCQNNGYQNGSACACPPGFGGVNCTQPACGGNIFQGTSRPLVSANSSFPNITASNCNCQTDWTGTGCNVCQTSSACQNAFSAAGGQTPTPPTTTDSSSLGPGVQNDTMVCSANPQVYAAGQMSCRVINPTVQSVYPGSTTFNILRTLDPFLTPFPNITGFGVSGSMYAQLWYDGVEQFYCQAVSCKQTIDSHTHNAIWDCQDLKCHCIPGTTYCGGGSLNIAETIDTLVAGHLSVSCSPMSSATSTAQCNFTQSVLQSLFGESGLSLQGCTFGECVRQSVINNFDQSAADATSTSKQLSGGVVAGLTVVGALVLAALLLLVVGLYQQKKARRGGTKTGEKTGGVGVEWSDITYIVPNTSRRWLGNSRNGTGVSTDIVVLDNLSGYVKPGQFMAILGPSGAGKTTLVEILAGKAKTGHATGRLSFPSDGTTAVSTTPRIGFVPQQDVLPAMLTVSEALLFAARLRLPESVPDEEKRARVDAVMDKLGITSIKDARIGSNDSGGGKRGISGGEMRRVSIGFELVAKPDVLILDEPTSGLDSVSAGKVARVLHAVAHDPDSPTAVIASVHQPSSLIYQTFDQVLLLSHGRALFCGDGGFSPVDHFSHHNAAVRKYPQGYNIADYLLEVASDPPLAMFQISTSSRENGPSSSDTTAEVTEKGAATHALPVSQMSSDHSLSKLRSGKVPASDTALDATEKGTGVITASKASSNHSLSRIRAGKTSAYATTFLTQLQVMFGREWKILRRDKTLFFTHIAVAAVLGVFCGGLYFHTDTTIAGFQSRVGCLFFLGALVAFLSLSALYNIVEIRPLFLRERSSGFYSPTAWLLSRFIFDVIPLRIIPAIIVSTITYWMAGLAPQAALYFKFLFILVLYTLAMTLFNFLLGTLFNNGGIAILLSALTALYQMTFAGFFAHLSSIPPVLRWLQWLCPLKYALEALCVNEVRSGLQIQDKLQGVPVNVSASLIMQLLFGFGVNNYYRDVLVLFAFIAGFGLGVIGVVWFKMRERR